MSAPGHPSRLRWRADDEFELDGIVYGCRPGIKPAFDSTPERFCLLKHRWAVEELEALLARLAPRRVVEVGIKQGGSAALISQLAEPEKLVGIELTPERVSALDEFASRRGLTGALSIHYGVDQADTAALRRIAAEQFGSRPVDLVIDDASHQLAESRRTFNALFPLLRPGGEYLLEDWSWAHTLVPIWEGREPLTRMVFELTLACAYRPELVASVSINRGWAVARRGEGEIDPAGFDLGELRGERGRSLLGELGPGHRRRPRRRRWRLRR